MPPNSQEVFRKHQTCAQHQVFIYELSAETSRPGTLKFPTIEPFLLLSPFSLPGGQSRRGLLFRRLLRLPFPACFTAVSRPFDGHFRTASVTPQSHAILEIMSDAIENTTGSADSNDKTKLIGRESDVVPGRFGEPLQIDACAVFARRRQHRAETTVVPVPARLGVERDGLGRHDALRRAIQRFRLVARAADVAAGWPLCPTARTRGCMIVWIPARIWTVTHSPQRKQSTIAVSANIPDDRAVVPIGFSQGGLLAIHLLRVHPERYAASISLSGFLAPGARRAAPRLPTTVSRRTQYSHVLRLRQQRYGDSPSRSCSP